MKEIRGDAQNLRKLLSGSKYAIDYYQREYRWQPKQVQELIDDLVEKFLESYESAHERTEVEKYGHYFLGSIIISDRDGQKFIIDGQQRLTTLTLLLVYLHSLLESSNQKGQLAELIFSQKFGNRSFNLDVPERNDCMDALFTGASYDDSGQPESVVNILARYRDIEDQFPEELEQKALPYFTDWLIENVHLVEITAYSDDDAYTIFETMNDRGLSLTATDMLKGYLLANISDPEKRNKASVVWRKMIAELQTLGKEEDSDAIKSWLRSQHAESIRERKRGALPQDFDLIGTEFHRWVRAHEEGLGLATDTDFADFIQNEFSFYTRWYKKIQEAAKELTEGLECIHFNAQNNFTLQYPVLLAPIRMADSEDQVKQKLRIVSRYLNILIARRVWNLRAISYSTMQYAMFLVIKEIRGKSAAELVELLGKRLASETETFTSNDRFSMHGMNKRQIHRMLARMTDFIETSAGGASRYAEYIQRKGKNGYEVEHIWANHPDRHTDEFSHPADFKEYRNRIGGLLLLQKSFNASYGDLPYKEKLDHYNGQNLLARSLHDGAYSRNPGFKRFIKELSLPFKAHSDFKKADMDARQELYRQLAEEIWDPTWLERDLAR
jgi:hypothetical protein